MSSEGVQSVSDDFLSMYGWSWNILVNNYKVWIYPVAVSFIQAIFTSLMSMYLWLLGPAGIFLVPLFSMIEFLLYLGFTVIIYFLVLISVKMFSQILAGDTPNFEYAKDEILSQFIGYILVGILAVILTLFVITIPLALLILVVSVLIGPSDLGRVFSVAISIISRNLGTVILLSVVAILLDIIAISLSSFRLLYGFLNLFLGPISTFIDILILGAFTYLSVKALGISTGGEPLEDEV